MSLAAALAGSFLSLFLLLFSVACSLVSLREDANAAFHLSVFCQEQVAVNFKGAHVHVHQGLGVRQRLVERVGNGLECEKKADDRI